MLQLWRRSLTLRIVFVFFGLLVLVGFALLTTAYFSWHQLLIHHQQQEHWNLAAEVRDKAQLQLATGSGYQELADAIAAANSPREVAEFYLLRSDGTVETHFGDKPLKVDKVDLGPIQRFLSAKSDRNSGIFRGTNPLEPRYNRIFSVAPLTIGNESAYLYALLHVKRMHVSRTLLQQNYVVKITLACFVVAILSVGLAGAWLFRSVTLPYRQLVDTVSQFRDGKLESRYPYENNHDIGELGATFNSMADSLAEHISELQRTDDLRRELVASISHDLRTPLTSIRGFIDLVRRKDRSLAEEQRAAYLDTSLQGIDSLTRLIDDLFELSKLEAKQKAAVLEECFIDELVDDVVRSFQPQVASKEITLRAEFGVELPMIFADLTMIERVLFNLISNAIRYTPTGGEIRVTVHQLSPGSVTIRVIDTGTGIPKADLPRLFEQFYRVDESRASNSGGAGLGLAIVKSIVEQHGGKIEVTSEVGSGTTFSFTLPTHSAPETTTSLPSPM